MLQNALFMLNVISTYITAPYSIWMPIAVLAVLTVSLILGLIYSLSGLLGRTEIRTWVRVKMYETLFSLILIFAFLAIFSTYFSIDPVPYFNSINLVPNTPLPCTASVDFYSLSACDIKDFLSVALDLNSFMYYTAIVLAFVPSINVNLGALLSAVVPAGIGLSFQIPLSPVAVQTYVGQVLGVLFPLFVLNQVQLLVLSSSLLIFTTLMALGLVARIFGVTRTFGGAMIAFAIGIGVVYPLMVSLTYGFVDYGLQQTITASIPLPGGGSTSLLNTQEWGSLIFAVLALVIGFTLNAIPPPFSSIGVAGLQVIFGNLITYGALVSVGLSIVPLLNLVIVDTFVIDFSKAVGEKMDFLSLLTNIL
ncbi:MAG: hypothetical protein KGH57_00600 [Candidatus Micrarchaeota archaeon]|nr:hypothetical protein [Candidatus Micrarchaeota archaeon]